MRIPTPDGGHVWAERRGEGEPLVLISGMSQSHEGMAGQFSLSSRFSLICLDNRGTGQSSDWPDDPYDDSPLCGDFAEDVISVLDEMGIARAHIVGFSMGGRIAQWVAIRFANRVGGLVLISSSPGERHGFSRSEQIEQTYTQGTPLEIAMLMYSSDWARRHPELAMQTTSSTTERSRQRGLHARATHLHDSWNALPKIKAPTLVMHGSEDLINPVENAYLLTDRIPGAEQYILAGGRHAIGSEFAEAVNAEIIDFLGAHPLSGMMG